jgi:hypothetical protein
LKLYTIGSAWFSGDEKEKGAIAPGQLADFAMLTADYFTVPQEQIKRLESVLTVVGGKVVYAAQEFSPHGPPPLPVLPDWAPVAHYGGYQNPPLAAHRHVDGRGCAHAAPPTARRPVNHDASLPSQGFWGAGCSCWAF